MKGGRAWLTLIKEELKKRKVPNFYTDGPQRVFYQSNAGATKKLNSLPKKNPLNFTDLIQI